jgi:diguanylate cyclase (GGDEF)-like protein
MGPGKLIDLFAMRIAARPAVPAAVLVALLAVVPHARAADPAPSTAPASRDQGATPDEVQTLEPAESQAGSAAATGQAKWDSLTSEEKLLSLARSSGDQQDIGTALIGVGRARLHDQEPRRALAPLREALSIANRLRDDNIGRAAALSLGDVYHALREYDAAERWVERANAYRDRLPDRFEPSEEELAMARAQAPKGRSGAAREAVTASSTPPETASPQLQARASPVDADTLDNSLRRVRWLLLFLAGLLGVTLWIMLRRGSQIGVRSDRLAREQRMLDTMNRTLRQETEKNRRLAREDVLTGALSRDAFAHDLERLLAHGARLSRPVALMMLDIDHFKEINDRYGHLAGDAALKLAVGAMRGQLDEGALLGRYGGDEFLVAGFDLTSRAVAAAGRAHPHLGARPRRKRRRRSRARAHREHRRRAGAARSGTHRRGLVPAGRRGALCREEPGPGSSGAGGRLGLKRRLRADHHATGRLRECRFGFDRHR